MRQQTKAQRFMDAAIEFAEIELRLTAMRQAQFPCLEKSVGDPAIGDYGTPPCDIRDPDAARCPTCQARYNTTGPFQTGQRRRGALKQIMKRHVEAARGEIAERRATAAREG